MMLGGPSLSVGFSACRFIHEGKHFAAKRLKAILPADSGTIPAAEKHLGQLYVSVLKGPLSTAFTDEERFEHCNRLRFILGSVAVLLSPLSLSSLSKLLCPVEEEEDIEPTLEDLHAILIIPEDPVQPFRLHHPSFRDFLLSKNRYDDDSF